MASLTSRMIVRLQPWTQFTTDIRFCAFSSAPPSREDVDEAVKKIRKKDANRFVDTLRLHCKAGMGGQGLPKHGGSGGRGGDIVVVGSDKENYNLKDVIKVNPTKRVTATSGEDARFFCIYGGNAKPVQIQVPLGITVLSEAGQILGEVNKKGDKVVVAKGGVGGSPANSFAAAKGQTHTVTLDLKLIADVGFLGFPNAGKSTLLKALSRATPKIASYPFTTISPNIGIMEFKDFRRISLADLPGLIEGAHANQGMGHKFLKHVERTKLLLFIVDLHGFQLSPFHPARSALETIMLLNRELELYQADLTDKPAILALNKMDLPNSYPVIQSIRQTLRDEDSYHRFLDTLSPELRPIYPVKFDQIIPISAAKDPLSVGNLRSAIRKQLDVNEEYAQMSMISCF